MNHLQEQSKNLEINIEETVEEQKQDVFRPYSETDAYVQETKRDNLRLQTQSERRSKNALPLPLPAVEVTRPAVSIETPAAPVQELTGKQKRELARRRRKTVEAGKKFTPFADERTAEIVEKIHAQTEVFDQKKLTFVKTDPLAEVEDESGALTHKELDSLTNTLLNTELTADMFSPARFAAGAQGLLVTVARFRRLAGLIHDNQPYFDEMKTADPVKYAGIQRCLDFTAPLERMATQAMRSSGLELDGTACGDAGAVEQARTTMSAGLEDFQKTLREKDRKRDEFAAGQLDAALEAKLTETEADRQRIRSELTGGDANREEHYPAWLSTEAGFYDYDALQQLVAEKRSAFDQNAAVAGRLQEAYLKALEAQQTLTWRQRAMLLSNADFLTGYNAAVSGSDTWQPAPMTRMKSERSGEYEALHALADKKYAELKQQSDPVIERERMLKDALTVLLTGRVPSLEEELTLQQFGYVTPDLQKELDSREKNARLETDTSAAQTAVLASHAPIPDYPANEPEALQQRRFMPLAHTLMTLDDDKDVQTIDFVQRLEEGAREAVHVNAAHTQVSAIKDELFNEAKERLSPFVTRVLDCDVDALTALPPEELLKKRGELFELTQQLGIISRMLELSGTQNVSLKYLLLADRADEYERKADLLPLLSEKARAASLLELSRFRPLQDGDLTAQDAAVIGKSPEEKLAHVQKLLPDADLLIQGKNKYHSLRCTDGTPEFFEKFKALSAMSEGSNYISAHEAVDRAFYDAPERLQKGDTDALNTKLANARAQVYRNNYTLTGYAPGVPGFHWTYHRQEVPAGGYTSIGEPILRSNGNFERISADLSDEEYRQALLDIGAGNGLQAGASDPLQLFDATEKNRRGIRVWKESMRIHYAQIAAKYGTCLETIPSQTLYSRFFEIKGDLSSIQTDTNLMKFIPGLFDDALESDVTLSQLLVYYGGLASLNNGRMSMISSGKTAEEISADLQEFSASIEGFAEARTYLVAHGLITDKFDWQAKPLERRRLEPEEEAAGAAAYGERRRAATLESLRRDPALAPRIAKSAVGEKLAGLLDSDSLETNAETLDLALRCEEAGGQIDGELYREAVKALQPRVMKVLDTDTDALLALTDEQLAARQDELLRLTADSEAVSELLKLGQDHVYPALAGTACVMALPLLRGRAGEYDDKLAILRALTQKARAVQLTALAKKEGLRADLFTDTENVWNLTGEERAARASNLYMQSDETLRRLQTEYAQHRSEEADPSTRRFARRCDALGATISETVDEYAGTRFSAMQGDWSRIRRKDTASVSDENKAILQRVSFTNYTLSGETRNISEPLFRAGPVTLASLPAVETLSDDQLMTMLRSLSADPADSTPAAVQAAKDKNLEGLRAYKEIQRRGYDYLARKYGSSIETMSPGDIADHYGELCRDFTTLMQTDDHILSTHPELYDMSKPEDVALAKRIVYFFGISSIIRDWVVLPTTGMKSSDVSAFVSGHLQSVRSQADVAWLDQHGDLHKDVRWDEKV